MVFAVVGLRGPSPDPYGPLGGHREHAADPRRGLSDEAVKWKMLSTGKPERASRSGRLNTRRRYLKNRLGIQVTVQGTRTMRIRTAVIAPTNGQTTTLGTGTREIALAM